MRENRGFLTAVSDDQMLQAQKELAVKEGIFVQPESAATLAAYPQLRQRFRGTSVLILTGQGLKATHQPEIDDRHYLSLKLPDLKEALLSLYR